MYVEIDTQQGQTLLPLLPCGQERALARKQTVVKSKSLQ